MLLAFLLITQMPPGSDPIKALVGKEYLAELVSYPDAEPRGGHAAVIVVRPLAPVLAVMRDMDNYKDIFAHFVESKVTQRVGRQMQGHMLMRLDVSFGGIGELATDVQYMERGDPAGGVWIRMRALPGKSSFKRFDMDMHLAPLPPEEGKERTLVEGWSMVVPDIPLVPVSIIEHENRQGARQVVRAIRLRTLGVPYVPAEL